MYAIVVNGSRQHRVEPGSTVLLDHADVQIGDTMEIDEVLLYQNGAETLIGTPRLVGAKVIGLVVALPTKKTMIQKFRRRKNYRRLKGHTQPYVKVKVQHILRAGEAVPAVVAQPAHEERAHEQPVHVQPVHEQPVHHEQPVPHEQPAPEPAAATTSPTA